MDPITTVLVDHVAEGGAAHFMEHIWILILIPLELMRQRLSAARQRIEDFEKLVKDRPPLTPADLQRVVDRELERNFELSLAKAEALHSGTIRSTVGEIRREIRNLPCHGAPYTTGTDQPEVEGLPGACPKDCPNSD